MGFLDDIKSKHLSNFVLVTIGDDIRISTQKITFDGDYYKPILLNIPSISESLDIEQRKYKISSVSLSISDYLEDGERFSDTLNTVMNKEVNIWFASQSSQVLNTDECYKAGTYIVRSFSQGENKITLNCEDLSQDKLHKDLPSETVSDTEDILEKYRAKPKPMIFGKVDKSPCIIENLDDEQIILSDYNPDSNFVFNSDIIQIGESNNYNSSSLFIFYNDSYVNIAQNKPTGTGLNNDGDINFTTFNDGYIRLDTDVENNDTSKGNLRIISVRKGKSVNGVTIKSHNYNGSAEIQPYNMENVIDDNINTFGILSGEPINPDNESDLNNFTFGTVDVDTGEENTFYSKWFRVYLQRVSNINTSDIVTDDNGEAIDNFTYVYLRFNHSTDGNNTYPAVWGVSVGGNHSDFNGFSLPTNQSYPFMMSSNLSMAFIDEGNYNSITGNSNVLSNFNWSITDTFDHVNIGYFKQVNSLLDEDTLLSVKGALYDAFVIHSAVIKGIDKHNFFVSATGRGGEECTVQNVYSEILEELEFSDIEQINLPELGQYAFTVDKKINSKKLIEELSQSTPLYPYFKDGEFKIKSIKWKDEDGDGYKFSDVYPLKRIKAEDVINYKYDRTKIEKVYTSVNIKYHYDYGLKDFTKETGDITPNEAGNSMSGYINEDFNDDFDQEFVFESKYIRNESTALNLAKYLAGLHANQHNLINLTLPLNYLTFELGDIVGFDKLIQDRKMFGEDYTKPEERNGQQILPIFFVNKIKKSLDKVEISLYQLHNFSDNEYIEEEIPEVSGCLNQQAINYNPLASTSQPVGAFGSCFFPIEITPPEITSHGDEVVIPTEETIIGGDPEIILTASRTLRTGDWQNGTVRIYFYTADNLFNDDILSLQQGDIINIDFTYTEDTTNQDILDLINDSGEHEVDSIFVGPAVNILILNSDTFSFTGDSGYDANFDSNMLNVVISIIQVESAQEIVNPSLNIIWNKPDNIHEYIPELNINTLNNAFYKVFIYGQSVGGSSPVLYESDAIYDNLVENFQFNHIINIGEIGIPQNEVVAVVVQANNNSTFNEQSVYSNSPVDGFTLVWGESDEQSDMTVLGGDVNLDGNINVIDITIMIGIILGIRDEGDLTEQQFANADINNDGILDIMDIVNIVNIILTS